MEKSDSISKIAPALVTAQAKILTASKDSINPHFKSKYADLSSIVDACKSALNENGIAFLQTPEPGEGATLILRTMLLHSSGEWISGTIKMNLQKNDPQGYGSAMTYARRYGLAAIVGVCADEDDDGNAASGPNRNDRGKPRQENRNSAPDDNADLAAFLVALDDAFKARGFSPEQADAAIRKVLAVKKIKETKQLTIPDRHSFVDSVIAGKFDSFKKTEESEIATGAGK